MENRNSKSHPQRKEIPNSPIDHGFEAEPGKRISGYKETLEDKPESISKQQIDTNANRQYSAIVTTSAEPQSTKSADKLRDSSLDTPNMDLGKSSADALNLGDERKQTSVPTDATASKKPWDLGDREKKKIEKIWKLKTLDSMIWWTQAH